ncbi:MAG: cryptochrome/photolyase family protein [Pseudomonadales bacterium]
MTDLLCIAANQLFDLRHLQAHRDAVILMCEDERLCTRLPFHQQKLGFVIAAMRRHAARLRRAGFDVRYHTLADRQTLASAITGALQQTSARRLLHFDTEDRGLAGQITRAADRLGIRHQALPNPMFLTEDASLDAYFATAKKPRMASFYRTQRLRLKLLLEADGNRPLGGRWSFDADNRARLPAGQSVPALPCVRHDADTRRCLDEVADTFSGHPGSARELWLPVDRDGAMRWLDRFLEERLTGFGTYEDALSNRSPVLFHSVISPFLNVGLITPDEVVGRALDAGTSLGVPLNDLEGFLRQIVGWREFIRGAYRQHRQTLRRRNVWGGQRRLSRRWLDADTGLLPLDAALGRTRDLAWNHHIERLMVIANLMNLTEVHPGEAYRFFMSSYVDAYDWVMVPNVYGMGLTSDGGIFTSKPYLCGSNYIRHMSDYPGGAWTEVADGLYWRFVAKHRRVLAGNPRLAMMVRSLDRLDPKRLKRIVGLAEDFIDEVTECAA